MQYIPLGDFFGFLGKTVQPVSAGEKPAIAAELEQLYAEGKNIRVGDKSVSLEDAKAFVNNLHHAGIIVYDQWILQYSGLKNLLIGNALSKNNFDPKIILEHRLFPDFARFITPFLLPAMLKKLQEAEDKNFLVIAGYIHLLDADGKLIAQDKLDAWLKNKLSATLSAAKNAKTEQVLAQEINFVVSDEVIEFVNQFNKSFYATKIAYIDSMLEIMRLPASTQRLGGWIAAQLRKLDLNPEHLEKIKEIKGTVQEGKVRFLNQSGKVSVSFNSVRVLSIAVGLVFFGIFYLLWFDPFKDWGQPKAVENKSSFEQFTKEERMQMDSLVQSMAQLPEEMQQAAGDQFMHLPPVEMNVIYREPYKNKKAEQFHNDCLKDQALLESGQIDSCVAYPESQFKNKNYPNFKKLSENKGFQPVFLQNESIYQVLIVVFSNEADAPVFASLIDANDKISFKMNPGEVILLLPGSDWAAFRTVAAAELPSENYKHHFCLQDENFKSMLYSPYRLKTVDHKTVKLMLNESSAADTDFFLLDLYEALEPLNK